MNLEQILPSNMRLELIDDILYRIGLCLTSIRDRPKRHIIDHPIVVLIIIGIFLAERMIIIFIREDNEQALKILGAYGYFIGLRQELAAVFLLITSLTIGSQLIYYINYRNGIKTDISSCIPNDVGFSFTKKSWTHRCGRSDKIG